MPCATQSCLRHRRREISRGSLLSATEYLEQKGPSSNFRSREGSQFQIGDSTSEALRRLVHEINRCRTEQQELIDFSARSTPSINHTAERLKYAGKTMNLIKYDEPVGMLRKV